MVDGEKFWKIAERKKESEIQVIVDGWRKGKYDVRRCPRRHNLGGVLCPCIEFKDGPDYINPSRIEIKKYSKT